MTHRIANLDKNGYLVGYQTVNLVGEDEVEVGDECDLPDDGTYRYDVANECFMPLGRGFDRPTPAPISSDRALYLLVQDWDNAPQEVREWASWYERNFARRDGEMYRASEKTRRREAR